MISDSGEAAPGLTGPSAPAPRTLIVGANGRMGRMLLARASNAGIPVKGVDKPLGDDVLAGACQNVQLVLVCVPAKVFANVLDTVIPFLPKSAILADITSVKETPMRQMEEKWPGSVVGTHPLFGPGNKAGEDLPVAIVPGTRATPADVALVSAFFQAFGCRIFECAAEKHDQAMARIQNMNFITNLAYFAVLAGQDDLLPFLTPSFERRKKAAEKMLTEDAEMFAGLFEANGHSHEAVRQYRKMLNVAASGDIEVLCKRAQWWWKDREENGMR